MNPQRLLQNYRKFIRNKHKLILERKKEEKKMCSSVQETHFESNFKEFHILCSNYSKRSCLWNLHKLKAGDDKLSSPYEIVSYITFAQSKNITGK